MNIKEIHDKLKAEFAEAIIELAEEENSDPWINIEPAKVNEICHALRDEDDFHFDYLVNLSGMDYKDNFGVVYHLYSIKHKHRLTLKAKLDRDEPALPTVENIWKTANWHEREAWDMFGIKFEGHPNMIRILCPYDWEGFPLRKDYKEPDVYHGIKVPY
ncbi:MAG: NADH-quinone oxidoreductase subunit C [Candidatus Kapaibacterium sp.]